MPFLFIKVAKKDALWYNYGKFTRGANDYEQYF